MKLQIYFFCFIYQVTVSYRVFTAPVWPNILTSISIPLYTAKWLFIKMKREV